jgi:hypothetical protein
MVVKVLAMERLPFYEELSKVGIVKEEEYVTREAVIHCDKVKM